MHLSDFKLLVEMTELDATILF